METIEKLKTLTLKDDHHTKSISFPIEITQEIISRLPIKPILQFRSVSKQWLSLISHDPIFAKQHFTRSLAANRASLLISAYDVATKKRHFLSASPDGGPLTHVITLDNAPSCDNATTTEAQHLNGLVLFTSNALRSESSFAFVINPATRKVFKLPVPDKFVPCSYFFGYHESRNEHCVLSVRMPLSETANIEYMTDIKSSDIEFMIYSLSTYSWRKIDVKVEELPIDITGEQWCHDTLPSVCVNSVIHLMLETHQKIMAFDLTTEKFSTINIPRDAIPREMCSMWVDSLGSSKLKSNQPYLRDINGCLGLVCHDRVVERNKMCLWILKDYDSRVWVKKTVTFSESWADLRFNMYPMDSIVNMDKIVFSVRRLSWDEVAVPIYDMKTKGFKFVQFALDQNFLRSYTVQFREVRSYVESILPLEKNEEGVHEDDK